VLLLVSELYIYQKARCNDKKKIVFLLLKGRESMCDLRTYKIAILSGY